MGGFSLDRVLNRKINQVLYGVYPAIEPVYRDIQLGVRGVLLDRTG